MTDRAVTVLIVDDHPMVAEGLAEILSGQADIDVVGQAATAADGSRLSGELRPDVVVMDYRLPDGDGATATRRILDEQPDTAVVMLTASDDDTVVAAAIEAGCTGYVTKDVATGDIVAAVRRAAAGEPSFPAWALARMVPHLRDSPPGSRKLTDRETQILELLAAGASTRDIAATLDLTPNTVAGHSRTLRTKLGASSNAEAVAIALRRLLIR
jgi:DNA-binding NarL/FixJ family response regulator